MPAEGGSADGGSKAEAAQGEGVLLPGLWQQRQRALMRQDELASAAGVAIATVGELERGDRGAQTRTVKAIAKALGVDPQLLIENSEGERYAS